MINIPNLSGKATAEQVQTIGSGSYSADYINWARTMHLLHEHAPGWQPELATAPDGGIVHAAPVGACLMIRFRNVDGTVTTAAPQAIMDTRNNAIPFDKITARDITDTHRRGVCMAAAFTFGLAYELWAKLPLESGYSDDDAAVDSADPAWGDAIANAADAAALRTVKADMVEHWNGATNIPKDLVVAYNTRLDELRKAAA